MLAILFLRAIITNNNLTEGVIAMEHMNVKQVNRIYDCDLNSNVEFGFFWLLQNNVSSYTSLPIHIIT